MKSIPRNRRSKTRLSATLKAFSSDDAIWHLFGQSLKHALDILMSEQWQQEKRREEMLQKLPQELRKPVKELALQVGAYKKELRTALKEGSIEARGSRIVPQAVTSIRVHHLETMRVPDTELVCNLIMGGLPGNRSWQIANELEWETHLKEEMEYRAIYQTADRHGPRKKKEQLWNMYFRLHPWLATVVGEKLKGDKKGVKEAQQAAVDFANAFEYEAGVDVVGVAIHRERGDDLHVHLIFSETREVVQCEDYSPSEKNALIREIAKQTIAERKASGVPSAEIGRNKVMAQVRKLLEGKKKTKVLRIRREHTRPWQTLGPSFRGKLAYWEMSGRDPEVAEIGDRPIDEQNTFRGRIVEPVLRGQDLTEVFLDLWGERCLTSKMEGLLSEEEKCRVKELGLKAVAEYKEWGKHKPSVEDYILREITKVRDQISKGFKKELEDAKKKIEKLQKEKKASGAILSALEKAPDHYKRISPAVTIAALVKGVKDFEQLKEALRRFVLVFQDMVSELSAEALAAWKKLIKLLPFTMTKKKEPLDSKKESEKNALEP